MKNINVPVGISNVSKIKKHEIKFTRTSRFDHNAYEYDVPIAKASSNGYIKKCWKL